MKAFPTEISISQSHVYLNRITMFLKQMTSISFPIKQAKSNILYEFFKFYFFVCLRRQQSSFCTPKKRKGNTEMSFMSLMMKTHLEGKYNFDDVQGDKRRDVYRMLNML